MCAQHRVGARRRYETWPLRSAPCLSSQPDRSLRRRVCLAASQSCAQRATGCGYVDNAKGVAHISTAPSSSSSQIQFDDNEKESRTALTVLSQQRPGARPANPLQCHCAIFTRILTAIHNGAAPAYFAFKCAFRRLVVGPAIVSSARTQLSANC